MAQIGRCGGFLEIENSVCGHSDFGRNDCFGSIDQTKWCFIGSCPGGSTVRPQNIGKFIYPGAPCLEQKGGLDTYNRTATAGK